MRALHAMTWLLVAGLLLAATPSARDQKKLDALDAAIRAANIEGKPAKAVAPHQKKVVLLSRIHGAKSAELIRPLSDA
ncbi:MAG: hypothetical protein QF464_24195, partial [Myxococcota bacterium]|nr:hypothetical protein [Myxococcota bacterium]